MSDDEKKDKKGSRPNSSASSKSSKSDKSHKSDKSDKSNKSHKSDKSHQSHKSDRPKSSKDDVETTEQEATKTEETVTNAEAPPVQEVEVETAAPPEATEYKPEEATPATQEAEATEESKAEDGAEAPAAAETEQAPVPAELAAAETEQAPVPAEPEPVEKGKSELELQRTKSVLDDLTDDERERFEALFEMHATAEKKLTCGGVKMLFRFVGEIVTEEIVSGWLKDDDKDEDCKLDFEEFCAMYKRRRQSKARRREDMLVCVQQLFPSVPDNGDDDSLSLDKVSKVMKQLIKVPAFHSEKTTLLNDGDIDDVIKKMDKNKDQKISREEFVNFLCTLE